MRQGLSLVSPLDALTFECPQCYAAIGYYCTGSFGFPNICAVRIMLLARPKTVREFMEKARAARHDSLGIAYDPETEEIFQRMHNHTGTNSSACRQCAEIVDIVDMVKMALAGQCPCTFADCVHDQVRTLAEARFAPKPVLPEAKIAGACCTNGCKNWNCPNI